MNENLPKPMLDALTREAKPAEHPSADLLGAYAEQALTGSERDSLAEHLARCAECREVAFLASGAAEELAQHSEELVAASRGVQARRAAVYAAPAMAHEAIVAKPKRWFASRWLWAAASVAAVFVLISGAFLRQRFLASPAKTEIGAKSEPSLGNRYPEKTEPQKYAQPAVPAVAQQPPTAKVQLAPRVATVPPKKEIVPQTTPEIAVTNQPPAPVPAEKQSARASAAKRADSADIAIGGAVPSALPTAPRASGFAPNAGQAQQQIDSLNMTVSRALSNTSHTRSNWRISPEGQLEHLTSDGWIRVLADQPSAFRVVSVVGNEVWAGGSNGMLFHSSDNGLHWNKVALASTGGEIGAITSIRFTDAQHGEVIVDSGASYSTSDGGTTWTKQ